MERLIPALLLTAALAAPLAASAHATDDCDTATAGAEGGPDPIRSRAALDARLARCPTPLDLMTPGGRARFLDRLAFNDRGLYRISLAELEAELTRDEMHDVVALFGLRAPAASGLLPEEAQALRSARARDGGGRDGGIERRFDRLDRIERQLSDEPEADVAEGMRAAYGVLFPATDRARDIATAASHDLRLLFRAARTTAAHTEAEDHLDAVRETLDALVRRDLATRSDIAQVHRLLIHAGRLDQSRAFARQHPAAGLEPLPPIATPTAVGDATPSALEVPAPGDALLHRAVALSPLRIVVVASYGCAFSQAAAQAIPRDPVLGPVFREHAVWLASPSHLDDLDAMRRWNAANPEAVLVVAASTDRWPMLDLDRVPQFHVFRDGALVESATGWPLEEGNRDAVLEALRRAGVVDASASEPWSSSSNRSPMRLGLRRLSGAEEPAR